MPGAAAKSLRMTAASPSRSSPLSHDSNTQIGSQRVAWQVLFQGSASVVNSVEGEGQGVGRFALRIPDGKASEPEHCRRVQIVVSKLPDCRVTVPGNSVFGSPPKAWASWGRAAPAGRCWPDIGPRSAGERCLSRQDVAMWGVRRRTGGVGAGVLVYVTVSRDSWYRNDRLLHHRMHADAGSAGPASLEPRSGQGDPGVWDALRFVFQGSSSEPEHSRLVQIVISKLPGIAG